MDARFIKFNSEFEPPKVQISLNDDIIKYGDDNNYPNFLQDLLRTSGLHRSIVDRKVQMLMGSELVQEDKENVWQPNPYETLNELLIKCAYDLETYGGYYLEVLWQRDGKAIAEIYHKPFQNVRLGMPNERGFVVDYYYWNDVFNPIPAYANAGQFVHYPPFSNINKKEPQIMAVGQYSPTNLYYFTPSYEASVLDIQTFAEISNYMNSTIHNNFSIDYLIFFRGTEPSDELKDSVVKELQTKYAGTDNAGKPMIFFLDSTTDEEPSIKTIDESGIADRFNAVQEQIINNIIMAHSIPKVLITETAGKLGTSKELMDASTVFRNQYIIPHQNILLRGINMIMTINNEPEVKIINPQPSITLFSIDELTKFLTIDEIRELFGYENNDNIKTDNNND